MRFRVARGDVWEAEFDPVPGHEQAGRQPAVVVSSDNMNQGPSELVMVVPVTRRDRRVPSQVALQPPEGGMTAPSFVMCEQLRTCSLGRLVRRRGSVSVTAMREIEARLRLLLEL